MDSSTETSHAIIDDHTPVILSYHSLNKQSHDNILKEKENSEAKNGILSLKSLSRSVSSSNSLLLENNGSEPDYSFGLSYNDHCYAQVANFPAKQNSVSDASLVISSPLYSHSIDDIHSEPFLSIPSDSTENSLDLLAKVAQAMSPILSSIKTSSSDRIGLSEECSLYTPDTDKLTYSMDYNWTLAQEEVITSTHPMLNSSKKTVSLVIPKHKLSTYQQIKSANLTIGTPHTSTGVSRSISTSQENNVDLDGGESTNGNNSLQQKTIKLLKPGSLPVKKLPPLRRYRYSGLGPNTSNIARLNSLGGTFQNHDNGNNRIMLSPNNGLVFTYGAGIIPASNAHVGPIRCPCGYTHDDGYMIQCDKCKIWQHVDCVLREPNNLPANFMCDACLPRNVNYNRAVNVQREKLAQQHSKKLQHQDIAHQHTQIQQQLMTRALHSTANNRTSKRKQDLQSLSGESVEYEEHLTRLPTSPTPCSQPLDLLASPPLSGASPTCSPSLGAATLLTPNGSTMIANIASSVTVGISGHPAARNLFSNSSGVVEDDPVHQESGLSPNSRFNNYVPNGHVDNFETLQSRNVYSSNQCDVGPASPWSNNSAPPNGTFNSAASFSHGLPMNHADYDEIRENICTEELRQLFKHKYELGRLFCYNFKEPRPSHPPLTRVVALDFSRKRLEAARYITRSTVVMEYRGCLSLFDDYNYEYDYRKHYNPFVLFYNKLVNVSLCVDARHCGNSARFIRRSCHPNCEVFHIYSNGRIQLLIVANDDIAPGRELTLPFDFDFTKCRYQITCACGRKACQVARWYRSQDKSHYIPNSNRYLDPLAKNNSVMLKKVSSEKHSKAATTREPYPKQQLSKKGPLPAESVDYNEEDDSQSDEEGRVEFLKNRKLPQLKSTRPTADIYNFSDDETKKERKQRFLKTISNKNRQQRLQQQMSRKLNSTTRTNTGMKSGRGRGLGRLSTKNNARSAISRVKRPSGSSATGGKRRASQAFSPDEKDLSSDNENEENLPAAAVKPRQRRQSSKSTDNQAHTKKESESAPPQSKKTREDIWLGEVLKRIERLEKKKKKSKQSSEDKSEIQQSEFSEITSTETTGTKYHESESTTEQDRENSILTEKENINGKLASSPCKVANSSDENEMVIRYHRTSITELQGDIDAITRAVPDLKSSETCETNSELDNNIQENRTETVAPETPQDNPNRKGRRKSGKFVELNFNEFLKELKPEMNATKSADCSAIDETRYQNSLTDESIKTEEKMSSDVSTAGDDIKEEHDHKTQSSVKKTSESLSDKEDSPKRRKSEESKSIDKNSKACRESRDEKWLRLQLKKIEEMEKKENPKQHPPAPPPPPKVDPLDDTLQTVVSRLSESSTNEEKEESKVLEKPDSKSGNSANKVNRRRRWSSREEESAAATKKSRKNSEDNSECNNKKSRKPSSNNNVNNSDINTAKMLDIGGTDVESIHKDVIEKLDNNMDITPPRTTNQLSDNAEEFSHSMSKSPRKSRSDSYTQEVKEEEDGKHSLETSVHSTNRLEMENLSSTSSDSESDDENKIEPIALQSKRRSSAPSGPETRSRVSRSGKKPSAQLRTPATAIEYQDRCPTVKFKKASDNWEEQECNLIVYKPQVENPMERFSRSLSTNLPVIQNFPSPSVTSVINTPPNPNTVMPTPTKKRWLNQAIMEDEENNLTQDNSAVVHSNCATTPVSVQFSLKKRLMAQYSVDDLCGASSPEIAESTLTESNTVSSTLQSNENQVPQSLPSYASPTAKLPPKKATMKRREEERLLLEMRKIRVSLSEYRRRKGVADIPHGAMMEDGLFKTGDEYFDEPLNLSGIDDYHHFISESSEGQHFLPKESLLNASINYEMVDQYADIDNNSSANDKTIDYGPRTPSEPNDEEEDDGKDQSESAENLMETKNRSIEAGPDYESCELVTEDHVVESVPEDVEISQYSVEEESDAVVNGPKTPEMDELDEAETTTDCNTCSEDIVSTVPVEDEVKEVNNEPVAETVPANKEDSNNDGDGEEEDFEKVKIDEEDLQKRISKLYPSHSNEEDVLNLTNILRRDEEIRDMQELKTLERQKNKLLYQLRSVEKVIPSKEENPPTAPVLNAPVSMPAATISPPSVKLSTSVTEEATPTKPIIQPFPKPLISPAKTNLSCGRMPLSEKTISPVPVKKMTTNLSALDAAIKNMNNSLKAQLAAAQQNIKSNVSVLNSSNNNNNPASTSLEQRPLSSTSALVNTNSPPNSRLQAYQRGNPSQNITSKSNPTRNTPPMKLPENHQQYSRHYETKPRS